jgi:ferredoxin
LRRRDMKLRETGDDPGQVVVWIDQDLCTGDGLCTDHCPEVFVLLEDGISYVVDPELGIRNDPGGADSVASVGPRQLDAVVAAADDCPGECIFIEVRGSTEPQSEPPHPEGEAGDGEESPADEAGS